MNTDCSTHPKGTNKKRARCACFRYFAVVIRHLISRSQRTPKSSTNVTAKVLKPAKLPQRLRRPTLRWLRSFLLSKCCRWRRVFPSRSYRTWQVTDEWSLVRKFSLSVSSIGYEKRESGESEVFHRIKSLICRKKRSFYNYICYIYVEYSTGYLYENYREYSARPIWAPLGTAPRRRSEINRSGQADFWLTPKTLMRNENEIHDMDHRPAPVCDGMR